MTVLCSSLRPSLRRDRRAVISVELAILANFVLLPVVIGATDGAELVAARSRLDQVVHAGLFYAYAYTYTNNTNPTAANVQTYAAQAYGGSQSPTVIASLTPYCIVPATGYPATGTPPQPNANGTCSSTSQTVQTYLVLTASVAVTLPFNTPWTGKSVTLSASGQARVS